MAMSANKHLVGHLPSTALNIDWQRAEHRNGALCLGLDRWRRTGGRGCEREACRERPLNQIDRETTCTPTSDG